MEGLRVPVCAACISSMRPQSGTLCPRCGEQSDVDFEADRFRGVAPAGEVCALCRKAPPAFTRAVAFGAYEGTLRELLHLLKYDGVTALAAPLGERLARAMLMLESHFAGAPGEAWMVVPVPLARGKRRQRGSNQAELLAAAALRQWARERRTARLVLDAKVLERTRETESQFGLTPHQRRLNLRGSFALAKHADVRGRRVLLVDDIYTTGATARACSAVLRRAGAAEIVVATLARAQRARVALWDGEIGEAAAFGVSEVVPAG